MRWNVTDLEDQPAGVDTAAWETVEIMPVAPVAAMGRTSATLVGALLVFLAVIGAGLTSLDSPTPGDDPGGGIFMDAAGADPVAQVTNEAATPCARSAVATASALMVIMPAEGEVILGEIVPIAGRIVRTRPDGGDVQPSAIHVSVVAGGTELGGADLTLVGAAFAGSIQVVEQGRGQIVELRVSDRDHPNEVLLEQRFVLGPRP
jgi:hypothetical protein